MMPVEPDVPRNRVPLFALFAAGVVSNVGNVMAMIAIPWFVLATTGSPARTGIAWAMTALPMTISGVFGGTLVDRLGFKRMSVVSDVASSLPIAMIPLLHLTVGLQFWQLLTLLFLGALLDVPGATARTSLMPDLARSAGIGLERANAVEQSIGRLALLLGAPAAGVLIAAISVTNVLWITAAGFIASASVIALFVPGPEPATSVTADPSGFFDDLRAGFAYVRMDHLILAVVVVMAVANFMQAMITVIYPVYAERVYGTALSLGVILTASGAGSMLSLLLFGLVGHRVPRRSAFIWSLVLAGAPLLAFLWTPSLAVIIVASFFRGFGAGLVVPVMTTTMQERVPATLRGRVFGLVLASGWVAMPAGALISGFMIASLGMTATLAAVSTAHIVVPVCAFLVPALHEMNRPKPHVFVDESFPAPAKRWRST